MLIIKNLALEHQLQYEMTFGQAQASPSECICISNLHGSDKQINKTKNGGGGGNMYNVSKVTPKRLIGLVLGQLCTSLTDYEGVHQRMLLLATTCALKKKKLDCLQPKFHPF